MSSRGAPFGPGLLVSFAVLGACGASSTALPRPEHLSDPLILERVEEALAACERDEPGALLALAETYDANDLDELALPSYELALARGERDLGEPRVETTVQVRYHRACVLAELGRGAEALAAFDEIAPDAREHAPLHARRGELLAELARAVEARAAFEQALALDPHGVPQRLGLARVQLSEGDAKGALATLEALAQEFPRERLVHGLLARAARALGDEERARAELALEEHASETTRVDAWSEPVLARATGIEHELQLAGAEMAAGDAGAALARLEPLYQRFPDDFALIEALARACNAARAHTHALEIVAHGRALFPERFQLELQAGIAALGLKRWPEARAALEHALALNPARAATHAAYGEVLLRQGDLAAAEKELADALARGERDARTRSLLAEAQMDQQAWQRASETLVALCAAAPENPFAWAQLAEARVRARDLDGARAALRTAEGLDPRCTALGKVRALLAESGGG